MANLMQLEVVTPDKSLLTRDDISYVLADTVIGPIGILANHAPLIATLTEGTLKLEDGKGAKKFAFVDGGFMEVKNNKVTILCVGAEFAEDIDVAKAERNLEHAKERLEHPEPTTNLEIQAQNLRRAKARLKTVELSHQ